MAASILCSLQTLMPTLYFVFHLHFCVEACFAVGLKPHFVEAIYFVAYCGYVRPIFSFNGILLSIYCCAILYAIINRLHWLESWIYCWGLNGGRALLCFCTSFTEKYKVQHNTTLFKTMKSCGFIGINKDNIILDEH